MNDNIMIEHPFSIELWDDGVHVILKTDNETESVKLYNELIGKAMSGKMTIDFSSVRLKT